MRAITVGDLTIKCDVPECDWREGGVKPIEADSWLDKPCPKCGANLMTAEDLKRMKDVITMSDVLSELLGDWPENADMVKVKIETHNGIRFKAPEPTQ